MDVLKLLRFEEILAIFNATLYLCVSQCHTYIRLFCCIYFVNVIDQIFFPAVYGLYHLSNASYIYEIGSCCKKCYFNVLQAMQKSSS